MPTVVLLDNSLSMRRRASTEESSKQLLSVAVQGLRTFFTYMRRCFPLEHCALLTFSSNCEIVSPFTRDYDELRQLLLTVSSQDRSDLTGSLYAMAELVVAEWGSFAPCQVVLVTDAKITLSSNRPNKRSTCLRHFEVSVHWLSYLCHKYHGLMDNKFCVLESGVKAWEFRIFSTTCRRYKLV